MVGLTFPGITSAYATNPLCYKEESLAGFGADPSGSSVYTAVALAQDISFPINNTTLDIFSAGSFYRYSMRTGGQNFPFHIDVSPLDINFIKIGTNAPNISSPSGTAVASYQFLMKYKQSYGTAALNNTWLFMLGCRPVSTTITVTPQDKVMVGMDWMARQMKIYDTDPISGSTIPAISDITGPVIIDADAGTNEPLTIDSKTYPTNGFTLTVETGLVSQPYNGSGLIDISAPGTNTTSGNFDIPVGAQGLSLETIALSTQTGVSMSYLYKSGVMKATIDSAILESGTRSFPSQASILSNPFSFKATKTTLATS
jgi:hypothetical protein